MEIGIKGHLTRNNEVVEILEMLGGKNHYNIIGGLENHFYYIDDKYISNTYIGPDEIKGYEIFSVDEFWEKFPYKVGDKVEYWMWDYYGGSELETSEITSMRWNCARCEVAYRLKDKAGEIYRTDIKGKVNDGSNKQSECEQCGRVFGSVKCFDVDCPNNTPNYSEIDKQCFDEVNKRYSEITHVCLTGRGYELPDGYHFVDENENVIVAKKIRLVKNTPYYPKTYEECCDVLNIPNDERYIEIDVPLDYNKSLFALTRLLICREAYWKIAGEWLELDKPWEPDYSDDSPKYIIFSYENEITLSDNNWSSRILVFPTIEMRNEFYENFKHLIEQCKKLL